MIDKAPEGKIWFCMACGKMSTTLSAEAGGWDESCAMNAVAIDQDRRGPTREQRAQFAKDREQSFARGMDALRDLTEKIERREFPSADLLALASTPSPAPKE